MKRIATLLLSVVFWLTALPWGAVSVAMDGNIIANGDFEDGKIGWSCNSGTADIVSDAYSGNGALQLTNPNAWGEAAIQTVAVQADTDYTITWYSKRVSGRGAFNLIPMNSNNWTNLSCNGQNWMNETSGNWVKYEITLNTGSATQVFLKLTSETTNAGSILIDDITMIPVSWQPPDEPDVPSDNLLTNGDFENGTDGWDNLWGENTLTLVSGYQGSYALHVDSDMWCHVRQLVDVEPNTDYIITGWYKNVTDMTLLVKDQSDSMNMQQGHMNGGADWTQITLEVNSGDNWQLYISLMGNNYNSEGIFDDLTMYPKGYIPDQPEDPIVGNSAVNGDFETGDETGWETYNGSAVKAEARHNGSYGLHLQGNGTWDGIAFQDVPVESGVEYTITMWLKAVSNGINIQIKDGDWSGYLLDSRWFNTTEWTLVEFEVTPTTNSLLINFCGGGTGWSESVYLDDVTVTAQVPAEPSDEMIFNGDFETGDFTGWDNLWGSNTLSITEGHDSAYAMSVVSGQWKHIRQKVDVEPNTDYLITGWYKDVNKMTLIVKDGADMKNLYQEAFTDGTSEWKRITLTINSGSETSLLVGLMGNEEGARGIFDDFSMKKATDAPATGAFVNGDFEQGADGWTLNSNYAYISYDAYSGNYALELNNPMAWSEAAVQTIDVEPYTQYTVTWYAKRLYGYGAFNLFLTDGDNQNLSIMSGQTWMIETSGSWVRYQCVVDTESAAQLRFKWSAEQNYPGAIVIDDITIGMTIDQPVEYPPMEENQLVNGGFEEGEYGWEWHASTHVDYYNSFSGNASAYLDNEKQYSEALTQRVPLRPDTDYVIIFYTKRESGSKSWNLFLMDASTIDSGAPMNIPFKNSKSTSWFNQPASAGWVKTELEFYSGTVAEALLKFAPAENDAGTFWLDNVGLYVKGYEPEEPDYPEHKEPMTLTSISATNNRPLSEEVNLLENGSFEGVGGQWDVDSFCTEHVSVVEDATTKWGNHSLYFDTTSSPEEEVQASFTVAVEPYTTYVFSVWIKGAFLSENNCGRATIGVAGENGRFLSNRAILFSNTTRQLVPSAWDDAWHLGAVMFETHNNTTATILMAGWGSQMWVDDMALYRETDGTMYMPANMSGSVEVSYNPKYTACKDEDSLIPDPTMGTADASGFWADAYGWRNGFMSFKDGALKYTSTGDNAATSIIKWVDVEPYTDYTFTMRLSILEDGNGRLELIDSKYWDKSTFYTVSFDSYDYGECDSDGWYTISLSFNSDAYDRIGIVFVDDGGEVLMDNMRLFKSEDGVAAVMGDINGDGKINTRDVGLFQRYLNGWKVIILTEAADVNGDGKINVQDIAVLQQYLCGWDVRLGG